MAYFWKPLFQLSRPPSAQNTLDFLLKQIPATEKAYIWKHIPFKYNPISPQKQNTEACLNDVVYFTGVACMKLKYKKINQTLALTRGRHSGSQWERAHSERQFQGEFISKITVCKGRRKVRGAMEIVQEPGLSNRGRAVTSTWPKGVKSRDVSRMWRERVV